MHEFINKLLIYNSSNTRFGINSLVSVDVPWYNNQTYIYLETIRLQIIYAIEIVDNT